MFGRWFGRRAAGNGAANGHYRHGNDRLIELRDVLKVYESAAGQFTALKSVDLEIGGGEFVAIIGKSGSGKSTLLNMITGIDRPTSGEVLVGDTAVHTLSESQMAAWRGRNLGIVFQFFQLLPALSIVENVMLPMDFCHMFTPRERRDRAMALLDQVDMAENAHKLPSAVSGGQQQRVAIARALANDPPIVIADEPTGNLDSKTADSVFALFEKLVSQGKTIVMVTHDNALAKRVNRAVIVVDGEIVNEYVAQALPHLNVDQLTWVNRELEPRRFAPGAQILRQGEPADRFYIITKGEIEVFLTPPNGQEIVVARRDEGQFFGEIGLLGAGRRTANVRAAPGHEVEVVTLDRDDFERLVSESQATREVFDRAARERERPAGPVGGEVAR
ncbi:MAG: ATP-binding cassette domain-containing protein [Kouleothrix sp.]|nr:ATP-binding cassette domain-containing protein [Kouleothrix sp.]